MFNKAVKNVAVLLLGSFMMLGNASAKDMKFGFVDLQAVAAKLPQMEAIKLTVNEEFKERVDVIEKLQADLKFQEEKLKREGATLSTAQQDELKTKINGMKQELRAKGTPLQQQMQRRFVEEQNKVMLLVQQAIEQISKDEGYDMIMRRESIIFSPEPTKYDISEKVVNKVKTQK